MKKNSMKQMVLSIGLFCLVIIGCSSVNPDEPRHDVAGLAERVKLTALDIDTSIAPVWYVYKQGTASDRTPGLNDFYLVAAIKLKSIDVAKYTETGVMNVALPKRSDYYPLWLPASVKNYNAIALGKKPVIYDANPLVNSSFKKWLIFYNR